MSAISKISRLERLMEQSWQQVRQEFFPRWDREKRWRLSFRGIRLNGCHGCCDDRTRTIRIGMLSDDPEKRSRLLIHEICHAIYPGHGRPWQRRLAKAAQRAAQLGRERLADLIRQEIEGYRQSIQDGEGTPALVYQQISDIVSGSPHLTYANVERYLRNEQAMTIAEFRKHYKRARKVFAEAKRDGQIA
jgi:hypothetical protein